MSYALRASSLYYSGLEGAVCVSAQPTDSGARTRARAMRATRIRGSVRNPPDPPEAVERGSKTSVLLP